MLWEALSNTRRKSISSDIPTRRSWVKKTRVRFLFPTHFSVDIWWNTLPCLWRSVFSLMWSISMFFNQNKRQPLHKNWVQFHGRRRDVTWKHSVTSLLRHTLHQPRGAVITVRKRKNISLVQMSDNPKDSFLSTLLSALLLKMCSSSILLSWEITLMLFQKDPQGKV